MNFREILCILSKSRELISSLGRIIVFLLISWSDFLFVSSLEFILYGQQFFKNASQKVSTTLFFKLLFFSLSFEFTAKLFIGVFNWSHLPFQWFHFGQKFGVTFSYIWLHSAFRFILSLNILCFLFFNNLSFLCGFIFWLTSLQILEF